MTLGTALGAIGVQSVVGTATTIGAAVAFIMEFAGVVGVSATGVAMGSGVLREATTSCAATAKAPKRLPRLGESQRAATNSRVDASAPSTPTTAITARPTT